MSPRNNKIINPVSMAPIIPSDNKLFTALMTYILWSNSKDIFTSLGKIFCMVGTADLISLTTSHVEASALLVTGIYTARLPFTSANPDVTSAPSSIVAISRMKMVGPWPFFKGMLRKSSTLSRIVFVGVISILSPMRMFPAGATRLFSASASTISSGVQLRPRINSGSTFMTIVRAFPPNGWGEDTPGMDENRGLILVAAKSCISFKLRLSLLKTNCPTGSEEASNRTTIGGNVDDGIWARARLT